MIKQIFVNDPNLKLNYHYKTTHYYDVICQEDGFKFKLTPYNQLIEKRFEEKLFQPYIDNPIVFAYEENGVFKGVIEGAVETWNQTYRIWNILVYEDYRNQNIGQALMQRSIEEAKKKSCRAIVLEVQSCNYPAICFYKKLGFKFIGLDVLAYSNEDIKKKEVRIEMGLTLS